MRDFFKREGFRCPFLWWLTTLYIAQDVYSCREYTVRTREEGSLFEKAAGKIRRRRVRSPRKRKEGGERVGEHCRKKSREWKAAMQGWQGKEEGEEKDDLLTPL